MPYKPTYDRMAEFAASEPFRIFAGDDWRWSLALRIRREQVSGEIENANDIYALIVGYAEANERGN